MFEPVRGGTRGGQAEFKWSDVSADKDRENYLGHSINAPTGRWQKNKDVHWYNRDKTQEEAEREEEIRKVKELEADALAVALGFEPSKKPIVSEVRAPDASPTASTTTPGAAKAVKSEDASKDDQRAFEKEEKRRRKEARKEEKRARKHKLERGSRHAIEDGPPRDAYRRRVERDRSRSRSPPRRRSRSPIRRRSRSPIRRRSRSPPARLVRSRSPRRAYVDDRERRRPRSRSRSRTPKRLERGISDEEYGASARERERERDRRRWALNSRRDAPGGRW